MTSSKILKFGTRRTTLAMLTFVTASCDLSGSQAVGFQDQIEVGEQFLQAGQYESAYSILDGVSSNLSTQSQAQIAVGDSYLRADALLRAESAYMKAAELGDNLHAEIGMGKVALKRNNAETARFHFQNALERDDKNIVAWNGLGVAYDLERNHTQAQNSYRQAISLKPDHYEAINNLGLSLILSGNSALGMETLTTLTESRLDSATTRLNLAIALHIAGLQEQAERLATSEIAADDAQKIFAAVTSYTRSGS